MNKKQRIAGNEKWRLPIRVVILSACIIALSMFGMFRLDHGLRTIRENYHSMMNVYYQNKEFSGDINKLANEHHAILMEYADLIAENEEVSEIEREESQVMNRLKYCERMLSENVKGTEYEEQFNIFHLKYQAYLGKISHVFELGEKGESDALYDYINNDIKDELYALLDELDLLDLKITTCANEESANLSRKIDNYKNVEMIVISIIVIMSIAGLVHCAFLTFDIINRDALTQAYNISKLSRDFNKLKKKKVLDKYYCICTNIKSFSLVNKRFGTMAGDNALKQYCVEMQKELRSDELMARIGGDNFLYFVKIDHMDNVINVLKDLHVEIETETGKKRLMLENRCGLYPITNNDEFDIVMDAAYIALNQAKRRANEDVVRFDKEILGKVFDKKNILRDYKKSIEKGEFVVFYQPKVDVINGKLAGGEALVRWQHDGKMIPPAAFIPVLENEGSITDLDYYVFDRMCSDIKNWIDAGLTPVRLSSNFSKQHLRDREFADRIVAIINKYQISRDLVEVELTESSGYENMPALTGFVNRMNEEGIMVSLDDFGTGYSSLSLLKDINIDVVKIDKTFIDRICCGDEINDKLLSNVIQMIKDLNREIICEGVESREQCDFVVNEDCHYVQGYLFDKPLPHDEFETRLRNPEYPQE